MALTNLSQVTTSGISTLADVNLNNLTGVAATFTGNVTIGGTLTYDDVTNIDSVGLVTARSGVEIITGNLIIPDTIVHRGDTNTKIRFPTDDTVTVETAGSEALRITSGESVGIGTNAPQAPLHIFGSSDILLQIESTDRYSHIDLTDTSSTVRITNDGGTGTLRLRADKDNAVNNSNIQFEIDGSEKVRITSAGDMGLGTATPVERLAVVAEEDSSAVDNGLSIYRSVADDKVTINAQGGAAKFIADGGSSYIPFRFYLHNGTTLYESLTIGADGNIGINKSNPTQKLFVGGNIAIQESGNLYFDATSGFSPRLTNSVSINDLSIFTNNTERLRITSAGQLLHTRSDDTTRYDLEFRQTGGITDGNYGGIHWTQGSTGSTNLAAIEIEYADSGRPAIVFKNRQSSGTSMSEALRITSDGNVGINTNNPQTHLHVFDGASTGRIRIQGGGSSSAQLQLIGGGQTNPFVITQDSSRNLIFYDNATERLRIASDGTVIVGTDTTVNPILRILGTSAHNSFIQFADGDSNNVGQLQYSHNLNALIVAVNGSERLRITSDGYVSIGEDH